MNPVLEYLNAHWLAGATGIVGWSVGFFGDIGKEHFRRKLRLRDEHAHEIQKEVLTPIYTYLNSFYLPVCQIKLGPLNVTTEAVKRHPKDITQDAIETNRFQITATTPADINPQAFPGYEYWRESESFRRYFEDARKKHYPELLVRWVSFRDEFEAMRTDAIKVAVALVAILQGRLKLPPKIAWGSPDTPTWANYEELAVFIVHRQIGIEHLALYRNEAEIRTSREQKELLKCATADDAKALIGLIDQVAKDSSQAEPIRVACARMKGIVAALIDDFRFAVSKKPELKRCPFV